MKSFTELVDNVDDLERFGWPILSLIVSFGVWVLIIVALATPGWMTLNLTRPVNASFNASGGKITIGLIRTTEEIDTQYGILGDNFYTYQNYGSYIDMTPASIVIASCVVAFVICSLTMVLEFTNTYRVVKNVFLGPATVYLTALLTSALLGLGCGGFGEFYLYLNTTAIMGIKRHSSLRVDNYYVEKEIQYSAILLILATILSLLPIFFLWRLTVLLPILYDMNILERFKIPTPRADRRFVLMNFNGDDIELNGDDINLNDEDEEEEGSGEEANEDDDDEGVIDEKTLNDMIENYHKNS